MQELIWIGGPLLLAALLAAGDPRLPLVACAVASIAGTAGYATSPHLAAAQPPAATAARSPLQSFRLRVLLTAAACYGVAVGVLNLALVAYGAGHGSAAPSGSATEASTWIFAVITVGMASGSALGGLIIQGAGPDAAFLAAGGLCLAGAAPGFAGGSGSVTRSQPSSDNQSAERPAAGRPMTDPAGDQPRR